MTKRARDSMSTDLITARWDEGLSSAYRRMKNNRIRHLPVVDGDGEIVGIISDRDFQLAMHTDTQDYSQLRVIESEFDLSQQVKDYMSWPVLTVPFDMELRDVAEKMVEEKLSAFLVTRDSKVVGIITHEDLLRVLMNLLSGPFEDLQARVNEFAANPTVGRIATALGNAGI